MSVNSRVILAELEAVFANTEHPGEDELIASIAKSKKIVCAGAGRVGLSVAGFAKRLRHLGKDSFWIDDVTLPRMAEGDMMLMGSGSGETETMLTLARIAKRRGLTLALVTRSSSSQIRDIADIVVELAIARRLEDAGLGGTVQPMTTLFEQSTAIFFDAMVLDLMEILGVSHSDMSERHNTIE